MRFIKNNSRYLHRSALFPGLSQVLRRTEICAGRVIGTCSRNHAWDTACSCVYLNWLRNLITGRIRTDVTFSGAGRGNAAAVSVAGKFGGGAADILSLPVFYQERRLTAAGNEMSRADNSIWNRKPWFSK